MSSETTTIRARKSDSERLRVLADARQSTIIQTIHDAIDALERVEFLDGLEVDRRRLHDDPELHRRLLDEQREWDDLA